MITHKPYPSDASDAEWQFVVPHLCLLPEDAGQRIHNMREMILATDTEIVGPVEALLPVDLRIPGCPPSPPTITKALIALHDADG